MGKKFHRIKKSSEKLEKLSLNVATSIKIVFAWNHFISFSKSLILQFDTKKKKNSIRKAHVMNLIDVWFPPHSKLSHRYGPGMGKNKNTKTIIDVIKSEENVDKKKR